MKILIDPRIALLVKDFTDAQCAELLRCILEYPKRDCELGVWKFMKMQIEEDEQKYQAKCERMAFVRQKKLDLKSRYISTVEEEEIKEKQNKENVIKGRERGNAQNFVENSVEKPVKANFVHPKEFLINENFSFQKMAESNPKFGEYLKLFPVSVIEKAEITFKKKRQDQWATMAQILEWIEKQQAFYKINQGC